MVTIEFMCMEFPLKTCNAFVRGREFHVNNQVLKFCCKSKWSESAKETCENAVVYLSDNEPCLL